MIVTRYLWILIDIIYLLWKRLGCSVISYRMASESIIKDSFYKSRLMRSGMHAVDEGKKVEAEYLSSYSG